MSKRQRVLAAVAAATPKAPAAKKAATAKKEAKKEAKEEVEVHPFLRKLQDATDEWEMELVKKYHSWSSTFAKFKKGADGAVGKFEFYRSAGSYVFGVSSFELDTMAKYKASHTAAMEIATREPTVGTSKIEVWEAKLAEKKGWLTKSRLLMRAGVIMAVRSHLSNYAGDKQKQQVWLAFPALDTFVRKLECDPSYVVTAEDRATVLKQIGYLAKGLSDHLVPGSAYCKLFEV